MLRLKEAKQVVRKSVELCRISDLQFNSSNAGIVNRPLEKTGLDEPSPIALLKIRHPIYKFLEIIKVVVSYFSPDFVIDHHVDFFCYEIVFCLEKVDLAKLPLEIGHL
ncbi:hypothetical protein Lser_V15G45221 [Lactuca serriola]